MESSPRRCLHGDECAIAKTIIRERRAADVHLLLIHHHIKPAITSSAHRGTPPRRRNEGMRAGAEAVKMTRLNLVPRCPLPPRRVLEGFTLRWSQTIMQRRFQSTCWEAIWRAASRNFTWSAVTDDILTDPSRKLAHSHLPMLPPALPSAAIMAIPGERQSRCLFLHCQAMLTTTVGL
jgi:hypothetical protein